MEGAKVKIVEKRELKLEKQSKMATVLAVVIAGAFMVILNNSIVNVAVPMLMNVFGSTQDQIQWVISGYMLVMGVITPTTGYLADKWGTKKIYLAGFAIFITGSALGATAWNGAVLIAARAIQGVGGGLIMPVSMVIIYQTVPRERIGFALGIWGIAAMAAPVVGPTLSGFILQYYHWSWLFLVNIPVGILGFWLAKLYLPQPEQLQKTMLDKKGLLLVTITCFSLLYSLGQGHNLGWLSPQIIALLLVAIISCFLFIKVELKQEDPLLDLRIFQIVPYAVSVVIVSINTIGLFSVLYLIPIFTQLVQQHTPLETGIMLMPAALGTAIMMPVAGNVFDKIGSRKIVTIGLVVICLSTWKLSQVTVDTTLTYLMIWMAVRGLGLGLSTMPANTAGLTSVPEDKIGRASALTNTFRQLSGAFGIALVTMIYQHQKNSYLSNYSMSHAAATAIGDAFSVMALLSFLAIPLALYLGEKN